VRSLRAAWCLFFLCLFPGSAQTSTNLVDQPVTERQLLCWIVAGVPAFNLQSELQNRGMEFALDRNWLEGLKAAGADDNLLTALQKAQPPSAGDAQRDEFADRLLRVIKEKNAKKFRAAQLHLEELVKRNKSDTDLLLALGGFLNQQEDYEEAIPVLAKAVQLAPDCAYAHEQLSFAYYRRNMSDPSIKEAKAALALKENDPDAHKVLALGYLLKNDFRTADREFNEALKLEPDYAVVYSDLALSASLQGHALAVIKLYQKAASLDPTKASYFWGVAEAYEHLNRVDEAIAAYKRAKDLAPDDMRIRQNLGAAYCNSGRSEEAVGEFQELLALDPDWNMARLCLYKSLRRLGRMEEAAAVKAEYDKREADGGD
jgi:Flp pilus assembly protein TadD